MTKQNTLELFRNRIDLRTEWGKAAWKTIKSYVDRNSPKLGLLKSLLLFFPDKQLIDLLNVKPVDYQTDVESTCMCGRHLSKELYRMGLTGHSTKQDIGYHIHEKIKDKKPFQKKVGEFILGSECYKNFPDLLYDFGFDDLKRRITTSRSKNAADSLEEIASLSDDAKKVLVKREIDPEQLTKISALIKNLSLQGLESRLFYDLDPGKKNSLANWFKEGIKNKTIDDSEIITAYKTLANAPHMLNYDDLVNLAVYQYEFRKHNVDAVLGNIKDDLLYLDGLSDESETIKKYGKPNLDKHFVRPATKFKKRQNLEDKTIREKIGEEYISFIEALGVKNHFPEIEGIRTEVNKQVADKYEIGIVWNYLLSRVRPVFDKTKKGLSKEYKTYGEILKEYALTKEDYNVLKGFFKGAEILENERQSYLNFYSMPQFKEVAPKIMSIGRKLKLSEKLSDNLILRKNFFLKEDIDLGKYKVQESLDNILDKINNTYTSNKVLLKLREKDMPVINSLYAEGLLEKNQMSRLLKWFNYIESSKPQQPNEKIKSKIDTIKALQMKGLVEINPGLERFITSKYIPQNKKLESQFNRAYFHVGWNSNKVAENVNYKPLVERAKELSGKAFMKLGAFGGKGYIEMSPINLSYSSSYKDFKLTFYDPEKLAKFDKMKDYVALEKSDIEKIDKLIKEGKIEFDDGYKSKGENYCSRFIGYSGFSSRTETKNQSEYETIRGKSKGIFIHKNGYERLKAFG